MDKELIPVEKDALIFDVECALADAAWLWPRKRWPASGCNSYRPIAKAVVKHLLRGRNRVFRKPPPPPYSIPLAPHRRAP